MKTFLVMRVVAISLTLLVFAGCAEADGGPEATFEERYQAYIENPDAQNQAALQEAISQDKKLAKLQQKRQDFLNAPGEASRQALLDFMSREAQYSVEGRNALYLEFILGGVGWDDELENLLLDGDSHAMNLVFNLFAWSDGAITRQMSILLGQTIVSHPRAFMVALDENRDKIPSLGGLVGSAGPAYVDDLAGQIEVLDNRYAAIRNVPDAPSDTQNLILYELSKHIYQRRKRSLDD